MNHDSKIWNLPRKVQVFYKSGWHCKRTKFKSLSECERYLKGEIGEDTYISLNDNEVEDAASAEVLTTLCLNTVVCGTVMIGESAGTLQDTNEDMADKAESQADALRAMRIELEKFEGRMREIALMLTKDNGSRTLKAYKETLRTLKHNLRLFAKTIDMDW